MKRRITILLIFSFLIFLGFSIAYSNAYSSPRETGIKYVKLYYSFEPSNEPFKGYNNLGENISNPMFTARLNYLSYIGESISKSLGLRDYNPSFVIEIGSTGTFNSCFIYAENLTAIIEMNSNELTENIEIRGGLLSCTYKPGSRNAEIEHDMSLILSRLGKSKENPVKLHVGLPDGTDISLLAVYFHNASIRVNGLFDRTHWAITDAEGNYLRDNIYILPPSLNGASFFYAYSKPMDSSVHEYFLIKYRVDLAGYAGFYAVNLSATTPFNYTVSGLGTIPSYDTVFAPSIMLSAMEEFKTYTSDDARKLAGLISREPKWSRAFNIYVEDNTVRVVPKSLEELESYTGSYTRNWRISLCNQTLNNQSLPSGLTVKTAVFYSPCININGSRFIYVQSALDTVYIYSRSRGILLEAVYPEMIKPLGTGIESIAGIAWMELNKGVGNGYSYILALKGNAVSAKLTRVEGLNTTKYLAIRANGERSWMKDTVLAALIGLFASIPLFITRRPLLAVGLFLIMLGIWGLASPYSVVTRGEVNVNGVSFNKAINSSLYVYADSKDSMTFYITGSCPYDVNVTVTGGPHRWMVNGSSNGRSSGGIAFGDSMIYHVTTSGVGSGNCSKMLILVSGKGSPEPGNAMELRTASIPILLTGIVLLLGGLFLRLIKGGLWTWNLEVSFLYIASIIMVELILFIYLRNPTPCKIGGFCSGASPLDLVLKASMIPIQAYLLTAVYATIVAGLIYGHHLESGLDRRLILLGIGRVRIQLYKLAALIVLVALPFASARIFLETLVDSNVTYSNLLYLLTGSLLEGAVIALAFGGFAGLLSMVFGRLSYTLLIVIPFIVAVFSVAGIYIVAGMEGINRMVAGLFLPSHFRGYSVEQVLLAVVEGFLLVVWGSVRREV